MYIEKWTTNKKSKQQNASRRKANAHYEGAQKNTCLGSGSIVGTNWVTSKALHAQGLLRGVQRVHRLLLACVTKVICNHDQTF